MMLSKEKLMVDGPAKVLLPLLVPTQVHTARSIYLHTGRSRQTIDINDLLSLLLTGKPGTGAAPTDINALLRQLLNRQQGLMPADAMTKPPAPSETPVLSKPSVQLSVAGLGLSTILQALGFVGTPFGMGQYPSDAGTLATLVPIATAAIGATGGFGALGSIALKLLSAFRRPTT